MSNKENTSMLRRGVCKNPECDLCMSHEVQEVEPGADFICSECGQPLQEIKQVKKKSPLGMYIGITVVAAAAVVGGYCLFSGNSEESAAAPEPETTVAQPEEVAEPAEVVEVEAVEEETAPAEGTTSTTADTTVKPASNKVNMAYGTYTGPLSGGKPDGQGGEYVFTKACTIDLKDGTGSTVDVAPGDKIISTKFDGGVLTQGEIHFKDGRRKMLAGISQKL